LIESSACCAAEFEFAAASAGAPLAALSDRGGSAADIQAEFVQW
jgi:hypothetical protein